MPTAPQQGSTTTPHGPRLRLGISSCLLGEKVRYDGGHKRDTFLTVGLAPWVEWVPVCPEVEVGMGTPREAVQLVGTVASPRMLGRKTRRDWTDDLQRWAATRIEQLRALSLHGFVLTKNSPSCGLFAVRVHVSETASEKKGRGLWAAALTEADPLLPVEEEGRLCDAKLRENFVDRIFAHERWTRFVAEDGSRKGLVRFHTVHKLTIMSHSTEHYRSLGRVVAEAGKHRPAALCADYGKMFMAAMAVPTTRGRHVNVLQHLAGFLKRALADDDKTELQQSITDYGAGLLPLVAPLTLLRHHLRREPEAAWAFDQVYLSPYPKELMVRNHV
ncbi:MAG: DUF523 and DUF1722 domain-containing protein [Planctomycetes bacterium]|nr:DUF523 and DUF1722 domain-containing protein [Planctomycetota bacterium]